MYILGIESSCDESAAAIIKVNAKNNDFQVLSNIIASQIDIHKKYGGVIPEIAAREHVLNILPVINESLVKAQIEAKDLDLLAVTQGPGLITSLITGVETVRSLAYAWHKPLAAINHIKGHIYANFIDSATKIRFPAIVLTVSGGHTILILMEKDNKLKILGKTRDDAAGEAFDKGAKMLGLSYPGGPIIARYAQEYQNQLKKQKINNKKYKAGKITLPRPMIHSKNYDFSFSGLKTALLYQLQKDKNWKDKIPAYCFEYQQAIIDILVNKTIRAAKKYSAKSVMLSGGVSANDELRYQLEQAVKTKFNSVSFFIPRKEYTTDNAAMIAMAAFYKYKDNNLTNYQELKAEASLQL